MAVKVAAVVPSLGGVAGVDEALRRLRAELAPTGGELVWVHQGELPPPRLAMAGERLVRLPRAVGFARAVNRGLAVTEADWLAVVNDDVWLEPGWLAALLAAGAAAPRVVALQGVQLRRDDPRRIDGAGIGWNARWQAVQIGEGEPAPPPGGEPFAVFGVSATAALYRRSALARVGGGDVAAAFDERLGSWYEDVELAVRLAGVGPSLCVPAARALHAGGVTGARRPFATRRLLTRNRWLVVARLLGRRLPAALPALVAGELATVAAVLRAGRWHELAPLAAGWAGALLALPRFAHRGAPATSVDAGATALPAALRVGSPG